MGKQVINRGELMEEGESEEYIKPYEQENIPVSSTEQLGQDILRTFARVSDPPNL